MGQIGLRVEAHVDRSGDVPRDNFGVLVAFLEQDEFPYAGRCQQEAQSSENDRKANRPRNALVVNESCQLDYALAICDG